MTRDESPAWRSPGHAFLYGGPIGLLGGLIGLGGAEFRMPVLAGAFAYKARRAIALHLAISLITVVSAVSAAYLATALVHRLPEHRLESIICVLLVGIGTALIIEAFLPRQAPALLPDGAALIIPTLAFVSGAGV